MSTMLHFLTDMALSPAKQETYRKNAQAVLKESGIDDDCRVQNPDQIRKVLISELKTEEFASVGAMLCSLDPGPDPTPDPDPPPWNAS